MDEADRSIFVLPSVDNQIRNAPNMARTFQSCPHNDPKKVRQFSRITSMTGSMETILYHSGLSIESLA